MTGSPQQVFGDARTSDHAVCTYSVRSFEQVEGVLSAAGKVVGIQVSGDAFHRGSGIFIDSAELARRSSANVVFRLSEPTGLPQVISAQEAGVQSVCLLPSQYELVPALRDRGIWVVASLPESTLAQAREAISAGVHEILLTPPQTKGAFTGQNYVLFDLWESLRDALPQVVIGVTGLGYLAPKHLHALADSTVAELVFEIPVHPEAITENAKQFVVDKRGVLDNQNTATMDEIIL